MPYLLDTHTFIWWILDDPRLSARVRAILQQQDNDIFFSIASIWEISIKAQLGRIPFSEDPAVVIPQQIAANGLLVLPIEVPHALQVYRLPLLHRDPFDRMLVAQAMIEDLPLLTSDPLIAQYPVSVIW